MYKFAALSLAASAVVHVVAVILGQYAADVVTLAPIAVVYLVLAVLLFRRLRVAAWLTFLLLLVGTIYVLSGLNVGSAPNTLYFAMAGLNALTLLVLFVVLWRHGHKK